MDINRKHPFAVTARQVVYGMFGTLQKAVDDFNAFRKQEGKTITEKAPVSASTITRYLNATTQDQQYSNGGPQLYQNWVLNCVATHKSRALSCNVGKALETCYGLGKLTDRYNKTRANMGLGKVKPQTVARYNAGGAGYADGVPKDYSNFLASVVYKELHV